MVNVALWQLVIFVLAGVAVGAVVVMLMSARGKKERPASIVRPEKHLATESPPGSVTSELVSADRVAAALTAAETRQEKVKAFLKKRIANQRNVTVDETAKCLSVSPRRIRKLLENGTLVAIPLASGRLVSSVSVLDLVMRREGAVARRAEPIAAEPARVSSEPPGETEPPPPPPPPAKPVATGNRPSIEGLEPSINQLYWYFVDGYDKPCRSIRESLAALGLAYQYTDWRGIPAHIRKKIQREKVTA